MHVDLYRPIHKGLRSAACDLISITGRVDWSSQPEVAAWLAQAGPIVDILQLHGVIEDAFYHPALEEAQLGCTEETAATHRARAQDLKSILERLDDLQQLPDGDAARLDQGQRFYFELCQAVALDIDHLAQEEVDLLPIFEAEFTDDELLAIRWQVFRYCTDDQLRLNLRYVVRAVNVHERAFYLHNLQAGPDGVFELATELAREQLTEDEWAATSEQLAALG